MKLNGSEASKENQNFPLLSLSSSKRLKLGEGSAGKIIIKKAKRSNSQNAFLKKKGGIYCRFFDLFFFLEKKRGDYFAFFTLFFEKGRGILAFFALIGD